MNRPFRWVGPLAAAAALMIAPLTGQERSLSIERFDADVGVNADASIEVTERITVRFAGQWNGMYRTIPVEYRTPQGFNWTIRLTLQSATDEGGTKLKVQSTRERHYQKYKIWVPGAQDATHTITLRYRARNGLRFFEDHDELYWNITGDEWDVPVGLATAVIRLPSGAEGVRATAFTGSYGSTANDADVTIDGASVAVAMRRPLGFREGVTAVIGWDKGLVTEPGSGAKALGFLASNWPLLIPVPVFFAMLGVWRRRGKDPAPLPVTVQYQPPPALTPAECGTLIDNSVDMRDVTATLVDLAVRGFIRIEETERSQLFGLVTKDDYTFHLEKPVSEWHGLKPHEVSVLSGLFTGGGVDQVALSALENEFYRTLPAIKDGVFHGLIESGFYQGRPDAVRAAWMAGGAAAGIAVAVGGSILSQKLSLGPAPFLVAGVLVGVIGMVFGFFMPARTVRGARMSEHLAGFEEFLGRVEGDRLRDHIKTPEMFEQFLAFAMAFGVEKKWAAAFTGMLTEPPRWYSGPHQRGFNPSVFSNRLSAMTTQAASTMTSAPRSSSGSGFSGGSSGGGGGGGGGGGF